jgi:hypothetical protein
MIGLHSGGVEYKVDAHDKGRKGVGEGVPSNSSHAPNMQWERGLCSGGHVSLKRENKG